MEGGEWQLNLIYPLQCRPEMYRQSRPAGRGCRGERSCQLGRIGQNGRTAV
jgi:hypothetical protein